MRVDPGPLGELLEGASRPGHFAGVLTVVAKLLNLTRPDRALLRREGLPAAGPDPADGRATWTCRSTIVGVPTVREADGLAMSSRNRYLTRRAAPTAARALRRPRRRQQAAAGQGRDAVLAAALGVLAADPDLTARPARPRRRRLTLEDAPAGRPAAGRRILAGPPAPPD